LFRHLKYLTFFTIVMVLAFGVFYFGAKRKYESKAKLLIRMGQEQTANMQFASFKNNIYITRRNQELKNELEILTSEIVAANTARVLLGEGVNNPELLNDIKIYIIDNLEVEPLYESDTLEVSFKFPDPDIAQKMLKLILDQYVSHHIKVFNVSKEFEFIETKLETLKDSYEGILKEFSSFMRNNKIYDDNQQISLLMEKRNQFHANVVELTAENNYHKRELKRLMKIHSAIQPMEIYNTVEIRNRQYENLKRRLSEARLEERSMHLRYQPKSRFIKDIEEEIALLEELIQIEPERIIDSKNERKNELYDSLQERIVNTQSQIEGEESKINTLVTALNEVDKELETYTINVKQYRILKKNLKFAEKTYEKYFEGYLENQVTQLLQAQNITNISIIEPPSIQQKPVWPNKKLMFAVGAGVLVMGNLFLLVLFNLSDTTISRPDQVHKKFGLDVFGVIPYPKGARDTDKGNFSKETDPDVMKEYQKMFVNISRESSDKVCLVTNSDNKNGNSRSIGFNLASFMSTYQNKKTVLLDLSDGIEDLQDKGQFSGTTYPDFENRTLDDVLMLRPHGTIDSEKQIVRENFEILDRLKKEFDYVFINIPAISDSPELVFLSQYTNSAVFVIEAEKTNIFAIRYNLDMLKHYGFKKISILLNKRRFYIPSWLYRQI